MSKPLIMTSARFVVKDGKFVEAVTLPDDIKISWINAAVIKNGYEIDTKVMDVCPIIFAHPFDIGVIHMAYNTPKQKFEVVCEDERK